MKKLIEQLTLPLSLVLLIAGGIVLSTKNEVPGTTTNVVIVFIVATAALCASFVTRDRGIRATMFALQVFAAAILFHTATGGVYSSDWQWGVLAVAFLIAVGTLFIKPRKQSSLSFVALGLATIVIVSGATFSVVAAVQSSAPVQGDVAATIVTSEGEQAVAMRYNLASIDEPLVGNGVNIATAPVLNDGKGDLKSWTEYVQRVEVMATEQRLNVIGNMNTWARLNNAKNTDAELHFPNWEETKQIAQFEAANNLDYRVILKVNTSMNEQQARDAVKPRIGDAAITLPYTEVNDLALVNTECGGADCGTSPSPAQQFLDTQGQVRVVLSVPVMGKEGYAKVANVKGVSRGIGLATECGNGLLGFAEIPPAVAQKIWQPTGTGNGDYTPPTPHTPPVTTTEPPVTTTEPPVTTTEPPVTTTEPPVTTTEPPVTTTEPPVTTTEPPTVCPPPPGSDVPPPVNEDGTCPKYDEEDPNENGNNQPGHGGQNDAPDPTPSDPAGGTAPATYTSEPAPMPTTEVRPDPIPTNNQGAPTDAPAPAIPAPGAEPCNPAICNEDGVDHAADAAAQAAAAAAEVASAPIAPVAPAATEAEAPAPAPAVAEAPAAVVADPTVDPQPTADTAGADVGDASDPVSDVSVAEVGLTSSATAEIPSIALWAIGGIIAIMFAGAFAANRNKPEEETKTVITMV